MEQWSNGAAKIEDMFFYSIKKPITPILHFSNIPIEENCKVQNKIELRS
jgi:hypothetical protein